MSEDGDIAGREDVEARGRWHWHLRDVGLPSRMRVSSAGKERKKPFGMLRKLLEPNSRVHRRLCGLGRTGRSPPRLL
jgi:hypothetical protein